MALAKMAIVQAEMDQKLRRTLLRKYAGTNTVLHPGQPCFFWRDAQAPDLIKIRWKGPATVIMREDGPDGKPAIYWLGYKSQLLRCAHAMSGLRSEEALQLFCAICKLPRMWTKSFDQEGSLDLLTSPSRIATTLVMLALATRPWTSSSQRSKSRLLAAEDWWTLKLKFLHNLLTYTRSSTS